MAAADWKRRLNPELRATYRQAPNVTFGPLTMRAFRLLERFLLPAPKLPDTIEARTVAVGDQKLRLFAPKGGPTAPAAMLWLHRGGRVMGTPGAIEHACIRAVERLGIVAGASSYRVAPEHPFPAALDDSVAAWQWLVDHADELGVDASRMAVGGESAGGGLAAELCQRLRDEGLVQPAGQALVYPMLDDRTATRDELTTQKHLVWNNTSNHYGWSAYLGVPAGSPEVPRWAVASRCEDLTNLPPAWLTVGDLDLFLDEDLDYAERLREARVPVTIDRVEGGFHGYFAIGGDTPPVLETWDSLERFLRTTLGVN
ncbi:MAG: alpha/beta hydrolase [Myxococcota bacterium]